jgi:glycosyltransferase 2 family protein
VTFSRSLRIVIAIGLTAFVLRQADARSVWRATAQANWSWIGAAVALVFLDRALNAWRWIDLLCALTPGSRPPFRAVLRIFFVSTFVGSFLPSVGGDAYRAYRLSRYDVRLAESAASVLMDRVLGVLAIALLGAVALGAGPDVGASRAAVVSIGAAAAVCAAVAAVIFSDRAAALGRAFVSRLPWGRVHRAGRSLLEAVQRYSHHHAELSRVLLVSLGVQVIRVLQAYCLGRALAIELPLATYFLLISIVLLVMLLPVTVNGLGTSQLAFDYLFGHAGVPSAQAVALSILFVGLGLVGNVPGVLLYASEGDRRT